jgi:hypothetical protein
MVEVSAEARSINSEIVRHRRHIHNFPEIGLETPRTAEPEQSSAFFAVWIYSNSVMLKWPDIVGMVYP